MGPGPGGLAISAPAACAGLRRSRWLHPPAPNRKARARHLRMQDPFARMSRKRLYVGRPALTDPAGYLDLEGMQVR
jgi:hypothetical protein